MLDFFNAIFVTFCLVYSTAIIFFIVYNDDNQVSFTYVLDYRTYYQGFFSCCTVIKHTSSPVDASISRNKSTRALTSFAAFALETSCRKGRIYLISPPSSERNNI